MDADDAGQPVAPDLDAAGGGRATLKWLRLDGWTAGTNRPRYLWAEFARTDEDGETQPPTLGAAIKASMSTGDAKPAFFGTPLAVGDALPRHDPGHRPSPERLREIIVQKNRYERAAEHRARVARDLFGLTDLARVEKTVAALTRFLKSYLGYLHGVLGDRVGRVRAALDELTRRRRKARDAERGLARLADWPGSRRRNPRPTTPAAFVPGCPGCRSLSRSSP